ncbi:MaoC family dehydratase [Clostridium transplantifaecale]|uniref:MaoC family dehydratase n=1 Tax=Clostridium transplantifaecale TaxID=2479838 RepID=UPI000F62E7E7|nr:MaoC family dehydratase [Clostridium transplantifaecale]
MVIGIKYCGGCNPRYQREALVKKLKTRFPSHTYVTLKEQKECDIWLLVCGCPAACVSDDGLIAVKQRFLLTSMKEFVGIEDYLLKEEQKEKERQEDKQYEENGIRYLHLGERASFTKTFYKEDADKFALLTGDRNRLHTDREFAEKQWFARPVVHGVLTASLISTVMGTILPGHGTILMSENLEFINPVYFGDTVEATVTFISFRETKKFYVGEFYGECKNQRGETVATGTARQMMMKTLFCVEDEEKEKTEDGI